MDRTVNATIDRTASQNALRQPRGPLSRIARKMMAGLLALSVGAIGLPAMTAPAQADGYYGGYGAYDYGGYDYGDYGYERPYAPGYRHYQPPRRHLHKRKRHAGRHYGRHHGRHFVPRHLPHHDKDSDKAAIAGAVIGLAIGAIIASEANRHDNESNRYRSYATPPQPEPRHPSRAQRNTSSPKVARQWAVAPEPFTDEWYQYCADRYRSFDPNTGTFQPYEGPRKLCR
jgi:hypothetical protein